MNEWKQELENLKDARKKIDARIKELEHAKSYRSFGTVRFTKGANGRTAYWKSVYRIQIKKHSTAIDTENGRYYTITEDTDLNRTYLYIKKVYNDLSKLIKDFESNGVNRVDNI